MKLLIGIVAFVVQLTVFGQGVLLTTGQSYVFTYDSVSYLRPANTGEGDSVGISFENDGLDLGESLLLEIFSGGLTNTPFSDQWDGTTVSALPEAPAILIEAWRTGSSSYLSPTLQGAIRVTMLSGTVNLSNFFVSQAVNGNYYSETFAVAAPEPAATMLMLAGVGGFAWCWAAGKRCKIGSCSIR